LLHDASDGCSDVPFLTHIAAKRYGVGAGTDVAGRPRGPRGIEIEAGHARTRLSKVTRDRLSETATGAGHESHSTLELTFNHVSTPKLTALS
jgi:hypothetical protein